MKYFTRREFDSADAPGSGSNMQTDFLFMLDQARAIAGIPFRINSGYRTPEHNARVGGSPTSSHMKGCAADIAHYSNKEALIIIQACVRAGFRRIGLADTFIHVDNDMDKAEAYWGYD